PHLARIGEGIEYHPHRIFRKGQAHVLTTPLAGPLLRSPSPPVQLLGHRQYTPALLVETKHLSDHLGFSLIHHQKSASGRHLITQRRYPSHPFPLAPPCRH